MKVMIIEDDHGDEERSGFPSQKGSIWPIHATTTDTLVFEKQKSSNAKGEEKEVEKQANETSVENSTIGQEGPNILGAQIEGNKEIGQGEENIVSNATKKIQALKLKQDRVVTPHHLLLLEQFQATTLRIKVKENK